MSKDYGLDRYDLKALRSRAGVKWSRDGDQAIAAWIADMDYPIAPEIHSALEGAIARDDLGYPSDGTIDAVRQAFAGRVHDRYGLVVNPAHIRVLADVVQGISLSLLALTDPGDGVVFFTPSYPPFFSVIAEANRRVVPCNLRDETTGYRIDWEHLDEVLRAENPRVLLLCNPHNPSGRCLSTEELGMLTERCLEHDLYVVSDEIHADLVLPGATHHAIGSLDENLASRTVTLGSASKAFNIAGLRCAVAAFGSEDLFARASLIPERLVGGASTLGMLAAVAAWEHSDGWLAAVVKKLAKNRALILERLGDRTDVGFHSPEATYLAWIDLREAGLGDDPAATLRSKVGIALSPGTDFGAAGRGHVRLNFATTNPVLVEILDRLCSALPPAA